MIRLDVLLRNTRYAVRRLFRDWRFTLAAVLLLAVGIGANTAMFSLVNAALLRPQALADPQRLVDIYQNAADASGAAINSYPAFRDMAEYTDIFASITAISIPISVGYSDAGAVRSGVAEFTTSSYLSVLGLRPALGRWFNAEEDTPGEVMAVIGHQVWTERFNADPSVIGRVIRINGVPVTIVGVGPVHHSGTINIGLVTGFWLPISSAGALLEPSQMMGRRLSGGGFFVKARLRDGVTVPQAQAAMQTLGIRLASEYPKDDPGKGITVLASSDVRIHPQLDPLLMAFATLLLFTVGLVLAIACSNLATLLLARGTARAKEVSVRLAVGATRRQLVCHLMTESLLLSVAGGACGSILTSWAISVLGTLDLPLPLDVRLDYRVFTFTIVLSLVTGMAFGLAPALRATRVDLLPSLRDEGQTGWSYRRGLTLKNALIVFQVAVSVLLLAGTAVFLEILIDARIHPSGFAIDGVAMIETDARYAGFSAAQAKNVYEELRQKIGAIPGVQSAALIRGEPMMVTGVPVIIERDAGETSPAVVAGAIWAGPGYFDLLQIPVLFGRIIDEQDLAGMPRVAVISESMARQYFGVVNAVGRRFRIDSEPNTWLEVIGVVRDTGTADLGDALFDPIPQLFYRSFIQSDLLPTTVLARTSLDSKTLATDMQRELRALNPTLPILSTKTMAQHLEASLTVAKTTTTFLGALGVLAAFLAGTGLYAVVGFTVSRRSREIGIRMALGAQRRQVAWMVAREVAALVGVGTGVGVALSLFGILGLRIMGLSASVLHFSYVVNPDPVALLSITVFMASVGLAAAYIPARRAARMDPLVALRHD